MITDIQLFDDMKFYLMKWHVDHGGKIDDMLQFDFNYEFNIQGDGKIFFIVWNLNTPLPNVTYIKQSYTPEDIQSYKMTYQNILLVANTTRIPCIDDLTFFKKYASTGSMVFHKKRLWVFTDGDWLKL